MIAGIKLVEHLTPRQTELGLLLGLGLTTDSVAKHMGLKTPRIYAETTKMFGRFMAEEGYNHRAVLALWFYEHRKPLYRYMMACKSGQAWQEPWAICEREMAT